MKKVLLLAILLALTAFAISRYNSDSIKPNEPGSAASDSLAIGSRLSELLGGEPDEAYLTAKGARTFHFPADHGPHPGFRNEWWYLTGNLDDEQGRRFGYELTFFRFSLSPEAQMSESQSSVSNWQTGQIYIAHFALTDEKNDQFHAEQRFSRAALGLAGAQATPFKVWVEDWSIMENPDKSPDFTKVENWHLSAPGRQVSLDLNLVAEKPPVLNGLAGLSRKSAIESSASWYYSISRMRSLGTLQIDGETYTVSGTSWLDREWSSSALAADQQGWDWFALQLSDGSDLMFYNIRKHDGSQDPYSAGTWIAADGTAQHLLREDVLITVTDHWQSPAGGSYPARWDIHLPAFDLFLTVRPVIPDQELITTVRYWEGAVDVAGRRSQETINGRGYVELTGYGL